ncbi:MAG: T9SS type A sorting domain-containing protein, partial [Bacteroidales bacterium]|nr:T9SS type A sorting domain-containing protein [Bacteroidales bacterium]
SPNMAKQEKETEYAEILFWGGSSDFVNYNDETWVYTTDIEISTSINETENNNIEIYPNPATDYIYINLSNELFNTALCSYQLLDIMGRKVNIGIISKENHLLDISIIPKGIYFLHIQANDELFSIQKIVKQ